MDRKVNILIPKEWEGREIKQILRRELRVSASLLTGLKQREDGILLNGAGVFVTHKVKEGDCLEILVCDGVSRTEPKEMPLSILYEDMDVLVVNKPRNMPTHPSYNHHDDTLANGLVGYYGGENFVVRVITRLDKDTSGVVLIAKNPLSGEILAEEMKLGRIKKEYLAITNGHPHPESGEIQAPIARVEGSMILRCVSPKGKEAVTFYQTVKKGEKTALVRLIPVTGRTHQLRVHMSYIGCPLYGDDLYKAPQQGEAIRLHCRRLEFFHPISQENICVEAPMPEDMKKFFG